jgi:hypothetical protein
VYASAIVARTAEAWLSINKSRTVEPLAKLLGRQLLHCRQRLKRLTPLVTERD